MNWFKSNSVDSNADEVLNHASQLLTLNQGTIVPIPVINPVLNVLSSLINKIKDAKPNRKGRDAVSREIDELVSIVDRTMSRVAQEMDTLPEDYRRRDVLAEGFRRSSTLEDRFYRLFGQLEELNTVAGRLYSGSWRSQWRYRARDAKALQELREGLKSCQSYFKIECQVAIERVIAELEEVEMTKCVVIGDSSYDRDERILESLPCAEASYRASVNAMKREFLAGTRVEVLDEINQWAEWLTPELSGKAVCILTGGAGTGKSTIASEFARRCDDKHDYGASFFFVRGVADLDSTRLVFPTLAYQLAQSQDALRAHIVNAAHEHLKRGKTQQMKYEAPDLIHRPVQEVSGRHPPMFLVIDALDECSEETRTLVPEMLELLIASVRYARFPLRIFFTSRPNSLIENTLRRSQWAPLIHTISLDDLSPESVQRDMAIFVRDKLEKLPSGQELLRKRPEVAERLAERAGGLFVYAKMAMDFLGDYPGFVEDGLDELLSEGSSEFAAALQPLDDLYLTVLEIAFPSKDLAQAPRLRQALESTLGNIAVLRNPMSPAVLESLTGVSRRDIGNVLQRLRSVVLYDADPNKPDERFRPMHATFPQFLLDQNRCKSPWYRVDARCQHARLAAGSLRALGALEENMCRLPDPTIPRAEIPDLAERLGRYVPEHVQYACAHWAAHLGDACGLGKRHSGDAPCACREIGERLAAFARTKLGPWVEMMTYMGHLDMVAGALDVARTYIEGAPQYQDVDSLLEDAQHDLYLTILKAAFPSEHLAQIPRLQQALESTLGCIAILRKPISPAILESLTGLPRRDIDSVLQGLLPVVLYNTDPERSDESFRPIHPTFSQFLLDPNRCRIPCYLVDASRQHARFAAGCLRALLTLETNMLKLLQPHVSKAEIPDPTERLTAHVPEYVQYACAHWAVHLRSACGTRQRHHGPEIACSCMDITRRLESCLKVKLKPWVEIMAYMGRLSTVIVALDDARVYVRGVRQYRNVEKLLVRARELVEQHYEEIEERPYDALSGLSFSVSDPTIRSTPNSERGSLLSGHFSVVSQLSKSRR